ncbi:Sirohydrochlorin ferrochelatase [Paraliobacillus sp. PM-2]|uniref:sirohydrochlorin chelatase n=1 Tax=Paraliobacillus sp. PM-2 TaxID=1462524 RepID=UPI00061C2FCF|nr:CbiX/SirB N-terminal domain-containing protein [Paraliobacillus sp. PM-2]CQR47099.1 Sirohydrochlorin ferrochelatase [Paraliobacillus sp. PM-2]
MKAIIYVAHGSKLEQTNQHFFDLIDTNTEVNDIDLQKLAFLEANPSLPQIIDECKAEGATTLIVVPVFLLPGIHVNKDIPTIMRQKMNQYPTLSFYYAPAFNAANKLVEDTYERIKKVVEKDTKQVVLVVSHGSRYRQASTMFDVFITSLTSMLDDIPVYPAYLKTAKPSIEEQVSELETKDYSKIIVVPHFFSITMFSQLVEDKLVQITSKEWELVKGIDWNNKIKQLIKNQVTAAEKFY